MDSKYHLHHAKQGQGQGHSQSQVHTSVQTNGTPQSHNHVQAPALTNGHQNSKFKRLHNGHGHGHTNGHGNGHGPTPNKKPKHNHNHQNNININTHTNPTAMAILDQRKALPAYILRNRILQEIQKNECSVIIGETGCGKTTQIPQIIHSARLEGAGMIGVTQPRRVAAITLAMRVAQEMTTKIGEIVGYSVRFEDVTSHRTKVKYMTDGMLLREAMIDPLLKSYTFLILDEAHERTINTDILFGIIKQAQKDRKLRKIAPLKIIVMSATMNADMFSKYFNKCPVICLQGRTHPVTIFNLKNKKVDYQLAALCAVVQLHKKLPINHDFLVFLTGQEEIESLAYNIRKMLKVNGSSNVRVCLLYAGLPHNQQMEAWRTTPPTVRKIVLATNIAETSITIPNIKCVIDTGVVKSRWYCSTSNVEMLRVEPCSQAGCWQRAGRAGRDSPGQCYRLYTKEHFDKLPQYSIPDILKCPLAPTILQILTLGIDPQDFDLLDKPPDEAIKNSMILLKQLGAINSVESATLTNVGKKMAAFPVDPIYSKILLSATELGCLDEALSIVALLSTDGIFKCPVSKRAEALTAKQKFISEQGDHITMLNVFKGFCTANLKKQWCQENFLSFRNLTFAQDVKRQLLELCQKNKMAIQSCGQSMEKLLKCLVSGLFVNTSWVRNIGVVSGGNGRYMTATGISAAIHPSSVLHGQSPPPACVIYTQLISTQRTYISGLSVIEADWLYEVAPEFARKCRIFH